MKKKKQEKMIQTLNYLYDKCMSGIPGFPDLKTEAEDYLRAFDTRDEAIKQIIRSQSTKSATTGLVTGLGGIFTFPVALPTNIVGMLYVQMRMIMMIAHLCGYDIEAEQIKSFVYLALCGKKAPKIAKEFGFDLDDDIQDKLSTAFPKEVIKRINIEIAMHLISGLSVKGFETFVQMVPVAGGIITAGLDIKETREVAHIARKIFVIKKNMV